MSDLGDLFKHRLRENCFFLSNLMGACMMSEGSAEVLQWFNLIRLRTANGFKSCLEVPNRI